LIQDIIILEIY